MSLNSAKTGASDSHTKSKRKRKLDSPRFVPPSKPIITRTKKTIQPTPYTTDTITELKAETKHTQKAVTVNTNLLKQSFKSIPAQLREIGSQLDDKTNTLQITAVLLKAYEMALSGDMAAINFIADRLEGKAVQRQIVQNIDVINKVVNVLERVIVDPLPDSADLLLMQLVYEMDKIVKQEETTLAN